MIIDHRTYKIAPRRMKEFLDIFEEHALPVQVRHLGEPLGFYVTEVGPLNEVVHFWGYKDYADMEARRDARDRDPDWVVYMKKTVDLVIAQDNKIISPASFSPDQRVEGGC